MQLTLGATLSAPIMHAYGSLEQVPCSVRKTWTSVQRKVWHGLHLHLHLVESAAT